MSMARILKQLIIFIWIIEFISHYVETDIVVCIRETRSDNETIDNNNSTESEDESQKEDEVTVVTIQ